MISGSEALFLSIIFLTHVELLLLHSKIKEADVIIWLGYLYKGDTLVEETFILGLNYKLAALAHF